MGRRPGDEDRLAYSTNEVKALNRSLNRMKNNRRWAVSLYTALWVAAGLSSLAILGGCATQAPVATSGDGWRKDQVADAYVFGYPLVVSDIAREKATGGDASRPGQAPVNTLRHATALPPVGASGRPSVDTLELTAWLDVSSGPVLVSLPDTPNRRAAVISMPAPSMPGPT